MALAAILAVAIPAPGRSQDRVRPYAPDAYQFGRLADESRLRFCVDQRVEDWEVQLEIGEAIAAALLLEPAPHLIDRGMKEVELEELFAAMLEHCYIYMGFRLISGTFPHWLTVSRAYFSASYVFVTTNPTARSLGELPRASPIASRIASSADLRLISYLMALPPEERWPRFPAGSSAQALNSVLSGRAEAALIWEPDLWASRRAEPAAAGLRVISSEPLPETTEGVGAAILAGEPFLRTALDQAIDALVADGTIAAILRRHGFPAHADSAGSR